MKSEKETLLVLTSTGMEIAWRYAWKIRQPGFW